MESKGDIEFYMRMKKKRILIWETLSFLGGGQRVSLQAATAFCQKGGHEVVFLAPGEGPLTEILREQGFKYYLFPIRNYSLGKKNLFDIVSFFFDSLCLLPRFMKISQNQKIDLLYISGTRALIWGAIIGQIFSIPVLWHVHHVFSDKKTIRMLNLIGKLRAVKKIICVSECVKEQILSLRDKAKVVYNGVDISRFKNLEDSNLLEELGIQKGAKILTHIGTIQPSKKQDVLIKALPTILNKYPETYVLLVGPTRQESLQCEYDLRKLISDLRLDNHVRFLGNRDDIADILKITTTTLAMGEEACPLVILESCATGVPVVGPDVAGASELIKLSLAGMEYQYGNPEDLANVIIEMICNDSLLSQFSQNGREFAQKHSLETFYSRIQYEATEILERNNNAL